MWVWINPTHPRFAYLFVQHLSHWFYHSKTFKTWILFDCLVACAIKANRNDAIFLVVGCFCTRIIRENGNIPSNSIYTNGIAAKSLENFGACAIAIKYKSSFMHWYEHFRWKKKFFINIYTIWPESFKIYDFFSLQNWIAADICSHSLWHALALGFYRGNMCEAIASISFENKWSVLFVANLIEHVQFFYAN